MSEYAYPTLAKQAFFGAIAVFGFLGYWFANNVLGYNPYQSLWPGVAVASGAGLVLPLVVEHWFWHLWGMRHLLGIPDLRGRWEGWTIDQLNPKDPRAIAIEYEQIGPKVIWRAFSQSGATVGSVTGSILMASPPRILFVYRKESTTDPNDRDQVHDGVHDLTFNKTEGQRILRGTYFNNRLRIAGDQSRGNFGWIEVEWRSSVLRRTFNFDAGQPEAWQIPKSALKGRWIGSHRNLKAPSDLLSEKES